MWVRTLGREDSLKEEMTTHSSILAWEIPGTEEPDGLPSMRSQESDITQRLNDHHHSVYLNFADRGRNSDRVWSYLE